MRIARKIQPATRHFGGIGLRNNIQNTDFIVLIGIQTTTVTQNCPIVLHKSVHNVHVVIVTKVCRTAVAGQSGILNELTG